MKLRAICLGFLATLLFIGTASAVDDQVLDWPHNEDNGIYCYHCHSEDPETLEDWWINPPPKFGEGGYDPDDTTANWVCNRCHLPFGTRTIDSYVGLWDVELNGEGNPGYRLNGPALAGPTKTLHSKTTTGSTKDPWTTQCIDCHDPHFQTQKDWGVGTEDGVGIYIATGEFSVAGSLQTGLADPKAGPLGASTRGIILDAGALIPPIDAGNPSPWIRKGKALDLDFEDRDKKLGTGNGTRGLILVVDSGSPVSSRTYEIIGVSGTFPDYILTVNGELVLLDVQNGAKFGILYGASIRKNVITPDGTRKPVKYFNPNKQFNATVPTFGGPVDLTAGETEPVGLCQVCHTTTVVYDDVTPAEVDAHYDLELAEQECSNCHDILVGAAPDVDHTSIIIEAADPDNCSECHIGYSADADGGHLTSGCNTCHDSPALPYPDLKTAVEAMVPWINSGDGSNHEASDWGSTPLSCQTCHAGYQNNHQAAALAAAHDTHFLITTPLCYTSCHGGADPTEEEIVNNIHNPSAGTTGDCDLCHLSIGAPGPPIIPVELNAAADLGSETNSPGGAECTVCHTSHFDGHDYGGTTIAPNHTTSVVGATGVTSSTNCIGCHVTSGLQKNDAPTAINSPYAGAGEVHGNKGCDTCHAISTAGSFSPTLDGHLIISSNGRGDARVNGLTGGNCVECHGAFEAVHTNVNATVNRALSHPGVSFDSTPTTGDETVSGQLCNKCHTDKDGGGTLTSLDSWEGILTEHTSGAGTCVICHDASSLAEISGLAGTPPDGDVSDAIDADVATCKTCHTIKSGPSAIDHGGHLDTEFAWTAATRTSCGDDFGSTRPADSCHGGGATKNPDVVPDIHGNGTDGTCTICHVNPGASIYTRRVDTNDALAANANGDRNAECTVCHTVLSHDKPFIHHADDNAQTFTPVNANCAYCHKTANGATDHSAAGGGMVVDAPQDTPKMQMPCTDCHGTIIGDMGDGNNIMLAPLDDKVHDECITCHYIDGADKNIVKLVAPGGAGSIAEAMPSGPDGNTGGIDGGGTCVACHTTYFEAHSHHGNVALNKVAINNSDATGNNVIDVSWGAAVSCGQTGNCHFDYEAAPPAGGSAAAGESFVTWLGIQFEHDRSLVPVPAGNTIKDGKGSCGNCHFNNTRKGANDAKFGLDSTVADVVAASIATNCLDCHFAKKAPSNHGMDYINHFELNDSGQDGVDGTYIPMTDNSGCTISCHPAGTDISGKPDPIIGLHQSPTCDLCHTSQPDLRGYPIETAPPDFNQYGQRVTIDFDGVDCIECHQPEADAILNNVVLTVNFHGLAPTDIVTQDRHNQMHNATFNPDYSNGLGSGNYFCLDCHSDTMSDMETVLTRHMPGFTDATDCNVCHDPVTYSTDNAIVPAIPETTALAVIFAGKLGTSKNPGGNVYQACEFCHTEKDTGAGAGYRMHGMTADTSAADGVATEHDKVISAGIVPLITGTDTDCANCHSMATPTEMLNLHMGTGPTESQHSGTCLTCHLPSNSVDLLSDSPSIAVVNSGVSGTSKYCNECHTASGDYLMHSLAFDASMALDHNELGVSTDPGTDTDCADCHAMADAAARLALHNKTGVFCSGCHKNATLDPAKAVIDLGWKNTAAVTANCEDCHYPAAVIKYRMHGMDAGSSAGVHDKIFTSAATPDTDCAECHAMASSQEIIELHTVPLNTATTSAKKCVSCHLPSGLAATVISNGQGATGADQYCAGCHTGAGVYNMHGLEFGTGPEKAVHDKLLVSSDVSATKNNCGQCHTLGSPEARLDLHSVTNCLKCHKNTAAPDTVMGLINAALDFNAGTALNCQACHSGTNYTNHSLLATDVPLIALHDKLAPEVSASSSCGTVRCHVNNTDTLILAFHAAPSSDDCLICHTSTAGVQSVINLAKGGGAGSALCEDCHISGAGLPDIANIWNLHANYNGGIDHATDSLVIAPTGGGLSNTESCTSADCHGGVDLIDAVPGVGVHDLPPDSGDTYSCDLCHDAAGLLTGNASGNGFGTDAECLTCHGAAYFDSHLLRGLGDSGHENTPSYYTPVANEDWTEQGTPCGNCHKDYTDNSSTVDMESWDGILIEHDLVGGNDGVGACATCHDYNATTFINAQTVVPGDVTAAIATIDGNTCGSCHDDKSQGGPTTPAPDTTEDHGGHTAADFPWTDTLCAGCHQTGIWGMDVAVDVHGPNYSSDCLPCHTGGVAGAALLGSALNIVWGAGPDTCTDCHTAGFDLHTTHTVSKPNSVTANTASDPITDTCNTSGCHDTSGAKPFITGATATPVHLACSSCHNVAGDGSLISLAASKNGGAGGECNVCHDIMFEGHDWGLDTSGTKAHDTQKVGTDLSQSTPTTCSANGCHQDFNPGNTNSLDTWEGVLYEHDLDGDKNGVGACVYCHDNDTYTSVDTVKGYTGNIQDVIMNPLGTTPLVECLDCHYDKIATNSHGGHDATHFPWTAMSSAGKTTCGSSVKGIGCHDDTTPGISVVGDIHNGTRAAAMPGGNKCLLCHNDPGGGDGQIRTYDSGTMVGDPNQGIGSNALHDDIQCVTCHTKTPGEIHHTGADAANGNCIACHMPKVGIQGIGGVATAPLANRNDIMMPTNLACNFCHLFWPNNQDYVNQAVDLGYKTDHVDAPGKVMIYRLLFDPVLNQQTFATATTLPSHAISENTTTPINDYGACFACHGATGADNGRADAPGVADMAFPHHGMGNPVTSSEADSLAIGVNNDPSRHLSNFHAAGGWVKDAPEKTVPYNPGFIAFNTFGLLNAISLNALGGTKPYSVDDSGFKNIHKLEIPIRQPSCRAPDLGTAFTSAEYNHWDADLGGTVGTITVNVGGLTGSILKDTLMPLVTITDPTSIGGRADPCP